MRKTIKPQWWAKLWKALLVLAGGLMARPAAAQKAGHVGSADVFIKAVASSPRVYAGQALTVSYLLYHRVSVIEPDDVVDLKFKNCFVEEYPPTQQERSEKVDGHAYRVRLLKKYLLIPQLEGEIRIPVLAQHYSFNAPPSPDDFFGEARLVSKPIRSAALQLPVLTLPAPADSVAFCRAVGEFRFQPTYTVSRKAGNILTVRLKISGLGNLKTISLLPPPLPAHVDVFNVHSQEQHSLAAQGLQAEYTYSYDVLANYRGTYVIPGFALAYFNPATERYVSFKGPAFRWEVAEGALAPAPTRAAQPKPPGQGPAFYTKNTLSQDQDKYLFSGSRAYYGLLLLAGVLVLAALAYTRQAAVRAATSKARYSKQAKSRAIQAIRKIKLTPILDADGYYKELTSIVVAYLSCKLDLPRKGLCLSDLPAMLAAFGVPAPLQDRTLAYLNLLHKLRFSASALPAHSQSFYREELLVLIPQLDACLHANLSPQLMAAA